MVREAVKFQFSDDFKIAFKRLLKKYRTLKQDLLIYDKNEMENVSDEFIKEILKDMEDAEN